MRVDSEQLIIIGGCGAGWSPPIKIAPHDENSYGHKLIELVRAKRVAGESFLDALQHAREELGAPR